MTLASASLIVNTAQTGRKEINMMFTRYFKIPPDNLEVMVGLVEAVPDEWSSHGWVDGFLAAPTRLILSDEAINGPSPPPKVPDCYPSGPPETWDAREQAAFHKGDCIY